MLSDRMFMAATPKATQGQQAYTTAGSYTFVVPAGVTSISMVCIGGAQASLEYNGAEGGALSYTNNSSCSAGETFTVVVGAAGTINTGNSGASSSVTYNPSATVVCRGRGGGSGATPVGTGFSGGSGGSGNVASGGGGGGAGGYSAAGGDGGVASNGSIGSNGTSSTGGGGGGGGGGAYEADLYAPGVGQFYGGGGGGGVGLLGAGSNGLGGSGGNQSGGSGGTGGSSGSNGSSASGDAGPGGAYGGAAGGYGQNENTGNPGSPANGAVGAVRIIWGAGRSYPSNAANV